MTDNGLYEKTTALTRESGDYVRLNRASTQNASGRKDYKIDADVFLKQEQDRLSALEDDVLINAIDIQSISDAGGRYQNKGVSANFEWEQPSDSEVVKITIKGIGAENTIKIGLTDGGDEIMELTDVNYEEDGRISRDYLIYSESGQTLYFSVTGELSVNINYTSENYY